MITANWRKLPGKRTYHPLTPSMLHGQHQKRLNTRLVPRKEYPEARPVSVAFDRSYAVEKVRRDLTAPLAACELREVLELVIEAWAIEHPEQALIGPLPEVLANLLK